MLISLVPHSHLTIMYGLSNQNKFGNIIISCIIDLLPLQPTCDWWETSIDKDRSSKIFLILKLRPTSINPRTTFCLLIGPKLGLWDKVVRNLKLLKAVKKILVFGILTLANFIVSNVSFFCWPIKCPCLSSSYGFWFCPIKKQNGPRLQVNYHCFVTI